MRAGWGRGIFLFEKNIFEKTYNKKLPLIQQCLNTVYSRLVMRLSTDICKIVRLYPVQRGKSKTAEIQIRLADFVDANFLVVIFDYSFAKCHP